MSEQVDKIHGYVEPGFERVREAFATNFKKRKELGAACSVYFQGRCVVHLWGGYRTLGPDRQPWEEDTLAICFSSTKGLSAMVFAMANSRGWIDYEERVAHYWPEFAQNGKQDITVRQLLGHQAGLSAIDTPLVPNLLGDLDELARILAQQKPIWEPGSRHGYHLVSGGLYQNELIRRVDPQHRTIGQFLMEEIARPLGVEIYLGLPDRITDERIARLRNPSRLAAFLRMVFFEPRCFLAFMFPNSITHKSFMNPRIKEKEGIESRKWLRVEMPAANGVVTANALAKAYAQFAGPANELNLSEETRSLLAAPPKLTVAGLQDAVLKTRTCYSLGFWKPYGGFPFGSDQSAYGSPGYGGSFGFADPNMQIGYGYTPNQLGLVWWNDPRDAALRKSVYESLRKL